MKEAQDTYLCPSLRDRFAIAALPGVITSNPGASVVRIAQLAYLIADTMMAEMDATPDTERAP